MSSLTRKQFIRAAAAGGCAALLSRTRIVAALSASGSPNGDVRVAIVGLRGKGAAHIEHFGRIDGVRVVALCDVDRTVLAKRVEGLSKQNVKVAAYVEYRKLLEDSSIDAVVLATPNHWHALMTIWACQAGKDVYVEKPVCHAAGEGAKMVEAATRYSRVVQAGTQARSDEGLAETVEYIRHGNLGRIEWIKAFCYKHRASIGSRTPWYPDWLDYDLWCGPAPVAPLERNELHYDWHWNWSTGGGDLANIGNHQIDIARWFSGDPPFPRRVMSLGGRFAVDDAGDTPNTQLAVYAYPAFPVIFEIRGLPAKPGAKAMDQFRGIREGVVVQCERGYFAGFRGGAFYDNDGRRVKLIAGTGGGGHMANFISAVRSRRLSDLAAPLPLGRDSSTCCLLGNISWRLGHRAGLAEVRQKLGEIPAAHEALEGMWKHLALHNVNLTQTPLTLGPWIEIDPTNSGILGVASGDQATLERARFLHRGLHRPPYTIPANI